MEINFRHEINGVKVITAVAQDADTNEILMLANMNEEALKKTVETGKAHYWSTSRNQLWLKGESSGHFQEVKEILVDCDMDAVVLKIRQNFENSPDINDLKDEDLKTNQKRLVNPDDVY